MKLTEVKRYWNFLLRLFLAELTLNVLGMCIVSSTRIAEFDFLVGTLDGAC